MLAYDIAICTLDREITEIPIIPPLFGCEVDQYLKEDAEFDTVGFGISEERSDGNFGGNKNGASFTIFSGILTSSFGRPSPKRNYVFTD